MLIFSNTSVFLTVELRIKDRDVNTISDANKINGIIFKNFIYGRLQLEKLCLIHSTALKNA